MMALFNNTALECSKLVTERYSTSFTLGIKTLDRKFHLPIYAIYGFVRYADEIVDTFHDYDKKTLLDRFRHDTYQAIEEGISLNPVLHSFQLVVRQYSIDRPLEEAHGEFVRHKTTRRAHYDAFAPTEAGVFDTLLWNAEEEITECTRGNIAALLPDGRWVTPALGCGLLPGVGRALALRDGRVQEAVLRRDAVPQVRAWAFLNSLRGWVEASLPA